ncbi:MAG: methylthioribulose 1-phosphate dehydratase [Planctomycetaceae bacterium]|nr:methylthioribulose 1-phosphate dehydratase [Planctomycetaceae bacterium]
MNPESKTFPDIAGLPYSEENCLRGLELQVAELVQTGHLFYQRGWSVGTSSNYSVMIDRNPLELLVTASGMHKGRLNASDFVRINDQGRPVVPGQPKSSAETMLHVVAAQKMPEIGCVLHTHSIWGTILGDRFFNQGFVPINGFEMLKGLAGITTHDVNYQLKIFENTQDIGALSQEVGAWLEQELASGGPGPHGYLIRKHGLYTWGKDVAEAQRHIEIFEFLLECVGRQLLMA